MWTPKVPSKKQQDEPDLSAVGLQAATEKAVHTSLQKIGSNSKQIRSQRFRKQSFSGDERCNHCNEKGHKRDTCPHKKKFWYQVPPKDNQLKRHHWTKSGKQPVTCCTVCKTWRYDHDGGHLAKDHSAWKKSKEGAKKTSDTNK
eukprot:11989817-Ditylum_brightwellii.AAC.1